MTQATPPAPQYNAAPATFPGKTLGIVAVPVAIFFNLIGFILGLVARSQSKAAGYKNGPATAAIIIGAILFVIGIIVTILIVVGVAAACNSGAATCTSSVG